MNVIFNKTTKDNEEHLVVQFDKNTIFISIDMECNHVVNLSYYLFDGFRIEIGKTFNNNIFTGPSFYISKNNKDVVEFNIFIRKIETEWVVEVSDLIQ